MAFYVTIIVATLAGTAISFSPLDPIKALFFSAVINGVLAVPVMAMMMLITSNKAIVGRFTVVGSRQIIGWLATSIMAGGRWNGGDRHSVIKPSC
jgi:Mn2+/Fe2+ NRAMP family transporter